VVNDDIVAGLVDEPGPVRMLRVADLVDLRFRFRGLVFKRSGVSRVLMRAAAEREGWIVVTFPAQHVMERAFFESAGEGLPDKKPPEPPSQTESRPAPPIVSQISGRSVLTFVVGKQDEILYTAVGLLAAMRRLPLRVVSEAGPDNPLRDLENNPRTGIELPHRLLLSPPANTSWSHRIEPATPGRGGRVELWHTRVTDTRARAVWTRDFPGNTPTMPPDDPLTSSLSPVERAMFVHLTSNRGLFTDPGHQPYIPKPIDVDNLMLSTLGGWLDSLGQWGPRPTIPTISHAVPSEWRHRAAMGRDHYVRVMYSGFLCPFGHRANLVKVTERRFDPDRSDHAAYLVQRLFIVVRELIKTFDPAKNRLSTDGQRLNVLFPFKEVKLLTQVTPNLQKPENSSLFFPAVDGEIPFRFAVNAIDLNGRVVEFHTPMLFLAENFNQGDVLQKVVTTYTNPKPPAGFLPPPPGSPPALLSADLRGQSVALATSAKTGDTTVEVSYLVWGISIPTDRDPQQYQQIPGFLPVLRSAGARVPAISRLSGNDSVIPVRYARRYTTAGFDKAPSQPGRPVNPGEVFLELTGPEPVVMDFGGRRDRSGGLAAPTMTVAGLSRLTGPVSASTPPTPSGLLNDGADPLGTVADGTFTPSDFFNAVDAKLFGVIPLSQLVKVAGLDKELKAPRFLTETVNAVTGFASDLRRVEQLLIGVAARFPVIRVKAQRVRQTALALINATKAFSGDIAPVEDAFRAFSTALDELGTALPGTVDQAVTTLLQRVQGTMATWDSTGEVLSLKKSIEALHLGKLLPETVNARLEWVPDIQPWGTDKNHPIFIPHGGAEPGRFSLIVDLRGSVRPDLRSGADVTCTLEEFDLRLLPPTFEVFKLDFQRIRFTARAGKKLDIEVAFRGVEFLGPLEFVETLRRIIPLNGFSDPPQLDVTASGVTARYAMPLPNVAIGVFSLENIALSAYLTLPFVGTDPLEIGFAFCRREAPFRLTVSLFGGGGWFGIVLDPHGLRALDMGLEFGAAASVDFGVASGSLSVMAGVYFRLEPITGKTTLFGYFRARGEVDVLGLISASIELYLALGYEGGAAIGRARLTICIEIGFFSESVEIFCEKRFAGAETTLARALAARPRVAPTFAQMMAPYTDPITGTRRDPVLEYCTAFAKVG
jgi:hypothetical protein